MHGTANRHSAPEPLGPTSETPRRAERPRIETETEEGPTPTAKSSNNVVPLGRSTEKYLRRKAIEMELKMSAVPNPGAWREVTVQRIEHHLIGEMKSQYLGA